jgi:phospholipid/cholesterol/gamma-HCH transport system substrate-binding protein
VLRSFFRTGRTVSNFKSDVKVGLFVLFGLVLGGLVVVLLGNERRFFSTSVEFHTSFEDVQGLKPGAVINMGGVHVGEVRGVTYGEKATDTRIYVTLSIVEKDAQRIRKDATAQIVNKGLLGDKMVLITKGESDEIIELGAEIRGEDPQDMMGRVDKMAKKAEGAMQDFSDVAEQLANEQLHKDIRESAHALNTLLGQVTGGEGYPHRFLTDKGEAERISRVIANLDGASGELTLTLRELRLSLARVRTGPGFAHNVIYGDPLGPEAAKFGAAAQEVAITLKSIREGDGFARDMLFGGNGDTKDAISNVTQLTADLRDIVGNMKQGKGTVGALLVDPSIYEDLKRVLGNVERNSVLRALVRYSIKRDEKKPRVQVDAAEK